METKWYSDFGGCLLVLLKAVLISWTIGDIAKGFWGTVFLWPSHILYWLYLGVYVNSISPHNEFTGFNLF